MKPNPIFTINTINDKKYTDPDKVFLDVAAGNFYELKIYKGDLNQLHDYMDNNLLYTATLARNYEMIKYLIWKKMFQKFSLHHLKKRK